MVYRDMLPEALRHTSITAEADQWEGSLYLAQDGDDLQWRVYGCFGAEVHVLGGSSFSGDGAPLVPGAYGLDR